MLKKLTAVVICFMLTASLNTVTTAEKDNIIQNPSFEKETSDQLSAWYTEAYNKDSGATLFAFSQQNPHTGKSCVMVENKVENDSRYIQALSVEDKSNYKLSCWIRTEDVGLNAKGANLSIGSCLETAGDIRGTNGKWEYVEMYAKVGKGINAINVTVGIGGYGSINTGKAFFDDVNVEKVKEIPEGAIVAAIERQEIQNSSDTKVNDTNNSGNRETILGLNKAVWVALLIGIGLIIAGYITYKKSICSADSKESLKEDDSTENTDDSNGNALIEKNVKINGNKAYSNRYVDKDFESEGK